MAAAVAALIAAAPHSAPAQPPASRDAPPVDAPWFACFSGRYAIVLPQHYPTLLRIGRAKVVVLDTRSRGAVTVQVRRLDYIGMRLDVAVASDQPNRYELLRAEVWSRRWNVGPLSVGTAPWRWGREPSLRQTPLQGTVRLVGTADAVTLTLDDGKVVRTLYGCGSTTPPR